MNAASANYFGRPLSFIFQVIVTQVIPFFRRQTKKAHTHGVKRLAVQHTGSFMPNTKTVPVSVFALVSPASQFPGSSDSCPYG